MIEDTLEKVLAALKANDPIAAAEAFTAPLEGPATPRARYLWEQCVAAMPGVMADWQRRVGATLAVRAYSENT